MSSEFDKGASAALERLKTLKREEFDEIVFPRFLSPDDHKRISEIPQLNRDSKTIFSNLDPIAFNRFKKAISPRWQAMYDAIENGECSERFARGLLRRTTSKADSPKPKTLEDYAEEIAVHEIAAFASAQDRRMELRIKKKIPQDLFSIWAMGTQSTTDPELVRFFRDAYLNLMESGLKQIGFYLIVFSKVAQSPEAFDAYLQTLDPLQRNIFEDFRKVSLKSSRAHLCEQINSRITHIISTLVRSSSESS